MEKYELTIVLDPKVTTAKKKKVIETVEKVAGEQFRPAFLKPRH